MADLTTEEDYKFLANLTWGAQDKALAVPCKLFLPKRVRGRPRLVLFPDADTWHVLEYAPDCELRGSLGRGAGSTAIIATAVRIGSGKRRFWGQGLDEGSFLAHPTTLLIEERLGRRTRACELSLHLTESRFLAPFEIFGYHHDGSVRLKHRDELVFPLSKKLTLRFTHQYRHEVVAQQTIRWPELIARARVDLLKVSPSVDGLLTQIDDLLLLTSLAEGRRCACLQVSWIRDSTVTRLFRMNRHIPKEVGPDEPVPEDLIQAGSDFKEFLACSYAKLCDHPERELLWRALASLSWFEQSSLEVEFLRHFTALESTILAFRRMNGLESIGSESDAIVIGRDVQKFLKKHPLLRDVPRRRELIYENLPALFRVSFRRATEEFLQAYGIVIDDLWPLLDSTEGLSLLKIRNRLVHGDHGATGAAEYLIDAGEALVVIAQRCLLSMLGWDYRKSSAGDPGRDWKAAQKALTAQLTP